MIPTVFFPTTSGNMYMINFPNSIVSYCHPLLVYFYEQERSGQDLETLLATQERISLRNGLTFEKETARYYLQKYKYYRRNIIKENSVYNISFSRIEPEAIRSQIANITQVTFEITEACNLKCKYCGYGEFYEDYDPRSNKSMDVQTAKTLLDYLEDHWNSPNNKSHDRDVCISFYGGEPLLNVTFISAIVDYIKKKDLLHNRFTFSMTTNAVLLDKYIDFLVRNHFKLLISLDGNKYNNSYRVFHNGEEAFDKIYKNIKYIQEKYSSYFSKKVNFNAVLHNRNSISEIHNFIKREFGKVASIGELSNTGIRTDKVEKFFETYRNANESLHQAEDYSQIKEERFIKLEEVRHISTFLHRYSGNVFKNYNDFFVDVNKLSNLQTGTCFPFSKKLFITVKGKMLPCERIGHQFALGNVTQDGVELDFEKIAEKYNQYFAKLVRQCKHCYYVHSCPQCIFHLKNLEDKPVCNHYMNEKYFRQYLHLHMSYIEKNPGLYEKIMEKVLVDL